MESDDNDRALAAIQRWPTAQSKSWTADFLTSAHTDENIVAIVAVGSSVRSDVPSVDLDLIVLAKDPTRLKSRPPIEIDLRAYALDQVDSLIEGGNDLLGWSVIYGKPLFERNGTWNRIVENWRGRIPLPSVDIAQRRAADALRRFMNMTELGDDDAAFEQAVSYVTHLARAELLKKRIYPASRPELPGQLRLLGRETLADVLDKLIRRTATQPEQVSALLESATSSDVAKHTTR